ncbi:inositol 2-dehydrogenase, partial [Pseudomonas syringae pv. tagetis]
LNVQRWLLNDDYLSVQVVYPRKTSKPLAHMKDPQILMLETATGTRIDLELIVKCHNGYDIHCQVLCQRGNARQPEPSHV